MNAITAEFSFGVKGGKPITNYELLVERLADEQLEPRYGYMDAKDIRPLTDAEIEIVCKAYGDEVLDAMNVTALDLAAAVRNPVDRAKLAFNVEESCRHILLRDLQTECDAREQARQWENAR